MRKLNLLLCVLIVLSLGASCRLKIRQLHKEQKARFARESLIFFLNAVDLQRGRETLVTEAERLRYHQIMSRMQVYLIAYHAGRALQFLQAEKDWQSAAVEWARADSLTRGQVPGTRTAYKMVLLQHGYEQNLKEISAQGYRYKRMERQFPGLMRAFRKMSEYQYLLAKHLDSQGRIEEAIEHYLLVFRRDPQNFAEANRRVKQVTGRVIREIYDQQYRAALTAQSYQSTRMELFSMVEDQMAMARQEFGDSADMYLPDIIATMAERYDDTPERVMDLYLMTKNEMDGTLNQYVSLWRHQVLRGQKPIKGVFLE